MAVDEGVPILPAFSKDTLTPLASVVLETVVTDVY